jgi:hypothetical protein
MTRKIHELTPQELNFCRLRARGFNQRDAYREAFNKPRLKPESIVEAASRLADRPQVLAMLKDLFCEAKKSALLSHAEFLDRIMRDWEDARAAKNYTAAASFARLCGQCIGSLSETMRIEDGRLSDDQLIDKIAGEDPGLATALRTRLKSRDTFH